MSSWWIRTGNALRHLLINRLRTPKHSQLLSYCKRNTEVRAYSINLDKIETNCIWQVTLRANQTKNTRAWTTRSKRSTTTNIPSIIHRRCQKGLLRPKKEAKRNSRTAYLRKKIRSLWGIPLKRPIIIKHWAISRWTKSKPDSPTSNSTIFRTLKLMMTLTWI